MDLGFSTGCFYRTALSLKERLAVGLDHNLTAVEVSFPTPSSLRNPELDETFFEMVRQFGIRYIHAPWYDCAYGRDLGQSEFMLRTLYDLFHKGGFRGIVIHPDVVHDWSLLLEYELPFLVENMDPRKNRGVKPEFFKEFMDRYPYSTVLDLQHVFERGDFERGVDDFRSAMGDRIDHLHVSGGNGSVDRHNPLYHASNRGAISHVLKSFSDKPIILEGTFSVDEALQKQVKRELDFIRSCF